MSPRAALPITAGLVAGGAVLVLLWLALHHEPTAAVPRVVYHEATPEAELRTVAMDTVLIERGRSLFSRNCTLCHGTLGQGLNGPNLRDDHWLNGSDLTHICDSIANGNPSNGMAAWYPALKADDLHALAAFVASLQGSEDGSGKAPQGTAQPMTWRKPAR